MRKNLFSIGLLITLLSGCQGEIVPSFNSEIINSFVSSNSITSSSEKEIPTSFASIKEAMNYLVNCKNYTINVIEDRGNGTFIIENQIFFTENAYYDNYYNYEVGYITFPEGVCYFDLYEGDMVISVFLKCLLFLD